MLTYKIHINGEEAQMKNGGGGGGSVRDKRRMNERKRKNRKQMMAQARGKMNSTYQFLYKMHIYVTLRYDSALLCFSHSLYRNAIV